MRLDFNVLWVDDQPVHVDSLIKPIKIHMEEQGFEFQPKFCRSMEAVREQISDDVFTDEVDLILVDWDLGGKVRGQDAIAEIRGKAQYKDVIFYSARTTPTELREAAYKLNLEGIYCTDREGLVEEVRGVFDSLVKRILDLDHTRGIVMGATSDIDNLVFESLVSMHEKLGQSDQQEMLKDIFELIDQQLQKFGQQAAELKGRAGIEDLRKAHTLFAANDRLRILSRLLEKEVFRPHRGARPAVVSYMGEVVPERNILGHQVLGRNGPSVAVVDNKDRPVTVERTRELRRKILNLRSEFRQLLAALRANP